MVFSGKELEIVIVYWELILINTVKKEAMIVKVELVSKKKVDLMIQILVMVIVLHKIGKE